MEAHGVDAPALSLRTPRAARVRDALLTRARPTVRELALYAAGLGVLALAVFFSHVQHGGFVLDDWSNRTSYLYTKPHGPFGFITAFFDRLPLSRPGLSSYLVLTQQLFGLHMKLYLAFAVAVGWLLSVELYLLARLARIQPLHAGVMAALVLVLPASDSTRLYAGATFVELVVVLFAAGLLLGLLSLRRGPLPAVGAVVLWALAWSMHETAAAAILVAVVALCVVAARRGDRRVAWVFGATLLAAPLLALLHPFDSPQSFGTSMSHIGTIMRQSGTVLARSALPFGQPVSELVVIVLAAIAVAGVIAALRWSADRPGRAALLGWLALAGVSAAIVVIAYIPYIPSDPTWYEPLSAGPSNRINALAGIGYVGLVYGLGGVVVTLAVGRRALLSGVLPAILALVVGAGYVHQLSSDAARWDRAFALEEQALTTVKGTLPHPPHGTVIYMFGHRPNVGHGVPVFQTNWDLNAAIRLTYDDKTLAGVPVVPGTDIVCRADEMYPTGNGYDPGYADGYGGQVFVNVATGFSQRIRDQDACRTRGSRFWVGG